MAGQLDSILLKAKKGFATHDKDVLPDIWFITRDKNCTYGHMVYYRSKKYCKNRLPNLLTRVNTQH